MAFKIKLFIFLTLAFPIRVFSCEPFLLNQSVFSSNQQLSQYIAHLLSFDLPSKFIALHDEGAKLEYKKTQVQISSSEREFMLLSKAYERLNRIYSKSNLTLIDLASGTGIKSLSLIDHFSKIAELKKYIAVDYSWSILELSEKIIKENHPKISIENYALDLEHLPQNPLMKTSITHEVDSKRLYFLLGQTLETAENSEQLLKNITSLMLRFDRIVVSIDLLNKEFIQDELNQFNSLVFQKSVLSSLSYLNISENEGSLSSHFNEKTNDIEAFFTLNQKINISLDPLLKESFKENQKIRLYKKHYFTIEEIQQLFEKAGYKIETLDLEATKRTALVVASSNKK
jgi:uncharacterized SAM-dependent methyltransferase